MKHQLWKTGEAGAPAVILDRNGEVTLGLCKVCGQAEADLAGECPGPRVRVGHEACPCGSAYCRDRHLVGVGKFVQGSGFTVEEAERITAALNRELSPVLLAHATQAYMVGSVSYLHGLGLTGDDQPTADQLTKSIEAGVRAAFRAAGIGAAG